MSAVVPVRRAASPVLADEHRRVGWVVGLGLVALLFAPVGWGGLLVTVAVGILGITLPAAEERPADARIWAAATVLGVGAFVAARQFAVLPAIPLEASAVAVIVVAAVAEEAFFRRLAFSWCARWGDLAAVVLTAVAFAVVHVPAYGVGALPIDLAAGLIFGWQRWATGSWVAAAVTHAAANLVQAW
jgi:membrane protease YdiL (CAAX protease family)